MPLHWTNDEMIKHLRTEQLRNRYTAPGFTAYELEKMADTKQALEMACIIWEMTKHDQTSDKCYNAPWRLIPNKFVPHAMFGDHLRYHAFGAHDISESEKRDRRMAKVCSELNYCAYKIKFPKDIVRLSLWGHIGLTLEDYSCFKPDILQWSSIWNWTRYEAKQAFIREVCTILGE